MTPIKLQQFWDARAQAARKAAIQLPHINMAHAAPIENDRPVLALRYDAAKGALVPAHV